MATERQVRNEAAVSTLEDRQAALASAELRRQLAAAIAVIVAAQASGKTGQALSLVVGRVLAGIRPDVARILTSAMTLGWNLGRRQVLRTPPRAIVQPVPDPSLASVVMGAGDRVRERLDHAAQVATQLPMETDDDMAAVLGAAQRAVTGLETDAGWVVQRSVVLAKHQAASETGWNLVWVAERNACLSCLAYAGRVIAPGQRFPEGLTYGDHPIRAYGPLVGPPLHPNCRCQLDRTNLRAGTLDVPLAREAARTVARGLTDYASKPAQLRAAERLVMGATGLPDAALVRLPKSVMERAARNIRDGQFRFRPGSPEARAEIARRRRARAR